MKKNQGFGESIRGMFIRYALLPICAIVLLWIFSVVLYGQLIIRRNNLAVNRQVCQAIARQYTAYSQQLHTASSDETFMALLAGRGKTADAYQKLYDFNNRQEIGSIFYLLDPDGNILLTNSWDHFSNFSEVSPDHARALAALRSDPARMLSDAQKTAHSGERDSVYTMAYALQKQGDVAGFLVFDLLKSDFLGKISGRKTSITVITDEYENVVAASSEGIVDRYGKFRPREDGKKQIELDGVPFFLERRQVENSPFQVFTLSSMLLQRQMEVYGFGFIIICMALILAMVFMLAKRVSRKTTASLDQLVGAIGQFRKGNFDYRLSLDQNDEFKYLSDQYNSLVEQISELLELNRELIDCTRVAEIRQLQAQFNPHFIFNVLEVLKYVIYDDADKAAKIIALLANLLRYSVSYSETIVTLQKDMEYIQNYLALQKIRYDDKLQFHILLSDNIRKCTLPKLVIQPLVENCIAHGYRRKDSLTITVTGTVEDGNIVLRVTDNGDGIPAEKLKTLRERLQNTRLEESGHIGLYNSHRRLQLLYGPEYGLKIFSVVNLGTEVVLIFPQKED